MTSGFPSVSGSTASERGFGAQLVSFALVGLVTSTALYGLYLYLTFIGAHPLAAMSVAYVTGVVLSFTLQGRITFAGLSTSRYTFIRYVAVYAMGYVFNAVGLFLAITGWGVPHYWAQLCMIGLTAAFLFILQRWWVFKASPANPATPSSNRT